MRMRLNINETETSSLLDFSPVNLVYHYTFLLWIIFFFANNKLRTILFRDIDRIFTRTDRLPFRIIISVWQESLSHRCEGNFPRGANSHVVNLIIREYTQTCEISSNRNQSRISRAPLRSWNYFRLFHFNNN